MTDIELIKQLKTFRATAEQTYAFGGAGGDEVLSFLMAVEIVHYKGQDMTKKVLHDFAFSGSQCTWQREVTIERRVNTDKIEIRGERVVKARVLTSLRLEEVMDLLGIPL